MSLFETNHICDNAIGINPLGVVFYTLDQQAYEVSYRRTPADYDDPANRFSTTGVADLMEALVPFRSACERCGHPIKKCVYRVCPIENGLPRNPQHLCERCLRNSLGLLDKHVTACLVRHSIVQRDACSLLRTRWDDRGETQQLPIHAYDLCADSCGWWITSINTGKPIIEGPAESVEQAQIMATAAYLRKKQSNWVRKHLCDPRDFYNVEFVMFHNPSTHPIQII